MSEQPVNEGGASGQAAPQPFPQSAAEGKDAAREEAIENASSWGTPWSAVEAGWDGEPPMGISPPSPAGPMRSAGSAVITAPEPSAAGQGAAGGGGGHPPVPPPYATASVTPPVPPVPPASGNGGQEREEKPMTLMEHLGELRLRLVRTCIAVGLAFIGCYSFSEDLFKALCRPVVEALPPGSKLIFTALPEAFFVHMQVGLVAAIFVASPYIFYQIWSFIAPGLYEDEKQYILPIAAFSAVFFVLGASFCYFVVFPFAFTFFVGYANDSIAAMPSLKEYLSFALKLLIAFGLIFEMPLFTFFLARMGLVTAAMMRQVRRYAILVIFIVAAILTPPDVISQLLMAIPMLALYEGSIWVAVAFGRQPKAEATSEGKGETV